MPIQARRNFSVSLPVELHEEFRVSSFQCGKTMTDMGRELIRAFTTNRLIIKAIPVSEKELRGRMRDEWIKSTT